MRPRNMHNLLERIVKGLKCVSADDATKLEFDISDDAVEAWTEMFGEPPNEKTFGDFVNKALTRALDNKEKKAR